MSECLRMRLTHATSPLHASVSRELLEYLFPYIGRNPLLVNLVSRLVESSTRMQVCILGACPTLATVTRFRPTVAHPISDHLPSWFHVRARIQASRPSDSSRAHEFGPYSPILDPYFSPNLRIHPECSFRARMLTRKHVVAHQPTRANLTRAQVRLSEP